MEETKEKQFNKDEISKRRRNNARLYPLYEMISKDMLLYYSIEFLFLTITKGVSTPVLLKISALYFIMRIITQIPSVAITDFLGKRKSIILANVLVCVRTLILILMPRCC